METIEIISPKASVCQTEAEAEERPSSPNDCAICLEQLTDKSFTNSCLHMFCFHCLVAWSKVKIIFHFENYLNIFYTKIMVLGQTRMSTLQTKFL